MESLKRSMKAALMTPLVSSLALTWGKAITFVLQLLHSDLLTQKNQRLYMRAKIMCLTLFAAASAQSAHSRRASFSLRELQSRGRLHLKLTLKSRRASIWFWIMGIVLSSFSVFMVLITPSTLSRRGHRGEGKMERRQKEKKKDEQSSVAAKIWQQTDRAANNNYFHYRLMCRLFSWLIV